MKKTFTLCVVFLEWLAAKVGMTYEEVNVWLFCIAMPILFFILIGIIVWQGFNCNC